MATKIRIIRMLVNFFVQMYSIYMLMYVQFEASNRNISGFIDINVTKKQLWLPNKEYFAYC